MKITCQSCQAKYTIADEKVVGKVVKIRCKKCQETIVVNGMDAQPGGDAGMPAGDGEWTVNVADGDQRNMSVGALVDAFNQGVVHEETYCWRDGMEDWLPIREIDELFRAINAGRAPMLSSPNFEASPAGLGGGMNGHHANGTNGNGAHGNGAATSMFGGGDLGGDIGFGAEPAPVAARRAGGRAGGDLFGAANSSAEGGVETAASQEPEKLTGQRNENSVLFSLAALTEPGPTSGVKAPTSSNRDHGGPPVAASSTTATSDGSGLIDIRALSASMSNPSTSADDKKANVDDIMNLGGGGAFGALAAPILAPAAVDVSASINPGAPEQKKGSNMMLLAILGAGGMIAAAIVFVFVLNKPAPQTPGTAGGDPMASRGTIPTASAGGGTDMTAPTGTPIGDQGQAIPSGSSSARSPGAGAATTAKPGTAANPGAGPGAAANPGTPAPKDTGAKTDTPAAQPAHQETLEERMAREAGKSSGGPPKNNDAPAGNVAFDRGAAQASLSSVNVASCKKPDGPTGSGHVVVTFGADGNVVSAVVDAPPFSGTPVGGCVASRFRGAHVPAFSGSPVKVGKSFSIN